MKPLICLKYWNVEIVGVQIISRQLYCYYLTICCTKLLVTVRSTQHSHNMNLILLLGNITFIMRTTSLDAMVCYEIFQRLNTFKTAGLYTVVFVTVCSVWPRSLQNALIVSSSMYWELVQLVSAVDYCMKCFCGLCLANSNSPQIVKWSILCMFSPLLEQ